MNEEEQEEQNWNKEYNIPRQAKEYWIDTKGKIRKYKGLLSEQIISMHYEIAFQEFPKIENIGTDHLFNLGWIMIGSSCYHQPIMHDIPTQKQLDTLFDLGQLDRLAILKDGRYPLYKDLKAQGLI